MKFEVHEQVTVKNESSVFLDWKKVSIKKNEELTTLIDRLKSEFKTFKVKEGGVEKKYHFNGNNYEITFV